MVTADAAETPATAATLSVARSAAGKVAMAETARAAPEAKADAGETRLEILKQTSYVD